MSAPVRIEAKAWTDLRFATLARLLKLADADHALIKVAKLWSWQTEHYTPEAPTYHVDLDTIESVLGPGGADALVRAKLATESPEGYRIHGTEGQIEWRGQFTSTRQQAGVKRARAARRDAKGRMISNEDDSHPAHAGHAGPAQSSTHPAQSSALTHTLTPTPDPQRSDAPPSGSRERAHDPTGTSTECGAGYGVPGPTRGAGPTPEQRRAMVQHLRKRLSDARGAIIAEFGLDARPLPFSGIGEQAIALRLASAGCDADRVMAEAEHVIAVEVASARAKTPVSVQYLTWAIFEDRAWERALGKSLADATSSTSRSPRTGRVEPLPASAYPEGEVEI